MLAGLLLSQTERAVSVSAGFKLGAPINNPSNQNAPVTIATDGRWVGGPSLEVKLPYRLAIEVDALYRTRQSTTSYRFQLDQTTNPYNTRSTTSTGAWDFPLLLKRRFQAGSARPFVSLGYQWSHLSDKSSYYYDCLGPQGSCKPAGYPVDLTGGRVTSSFVERSVVAGGGLEFRTRYGTIAPEVRVTRPVNGYPKDTRVTGLVGFTFGRN